MPDSSLQINQRLTRKALTAETGRSGLKHYSGIVSQEFDPALRGQRGIKLYEEMRRNDPVIGAGFAAIRRSLRSVRWYARALEENSAADAQAEWVNGAMDDLEDSWSDFISEALTHLVFGWCMPGDQVVLRPDGSSTPIAEIQVGDLVMTKWGRPRRVNHVFTRHFRGDLIRVHARGVPDPIRLTPEHQLPTSAGWMPAGELRVGQEVLRPRLPLNEGGIYEDGWLVGAYLAEGHLRKDAVNVVCFSVHQDEMAFLRGRLDSWASQRQLVPTHHLAKGVAYATPSQESLGGTVAFAHPELRALIVQWVTGDRATTKALRQLPQDRDFARGVWDGWRWGDGYEAKTIRGGREYRLACGTTTNPVLAQQMQLIGGALGYPSPLRYRKGGSASQIRGRAMTTPPYYEVGALPERRMSWKRTADLETAVRNLRDSGSTLHEIAAVVGLSYTTVWKWLHSAQAKAHGLQGHVYPEAIGHTVTRVEREPFDGLVYDLEVDEDHTFCAGPIIVSNSFHEIVYKLRSAPDSKFSDGKLGWRKIPLRGQETLDRWEIDSAGTIWGMWQRPEPTYELIYIPLEKAILFRTEKEKNNPEGESLLRNAVRPYLQKKNFEDILAIGADRDLTGMPVIWLPMDATEEDKTVAADIVANVRTDDQAGLVLQRFGAEEHLNWGFELVASPGQKSVDVEKAIERAANEISLVFLTQFLRLGMTGTGSWALAKEQKDLFRLSLTAILENLKQHLNSYLLAPLLKLNGEAVLCEITHDPVSQTDLDGLANFISKLAGAKFLTPNYDTENALRGMVNLPKLTEDEIAEREAAAEAMREALVSNQGDAVAKDGDETAAEGPAQAKPEPVAKAAEAWAVTADDVEDLYAERRKLVGLDDE